MITYNDFSKLDIRIGTILSAEKVPETDKLILLEVDLGLKPSVQSTDGSPEHSPEANVLGEKDVRTIVAGIAEYISDPATLVGTQIPILANLEPRTIKGIESQGMILAASAELTDTKGTTFALLRPERAIVAGSRVR